MTKVKVVKGKEKITVELPKRLLPEDYERKDYSVMLVFISGSPFIKNRKYRKIRLLINIAINDRLK